MGPKLSVYGVGVWLGQGLVKSPRLIFLRYSYKFILLIVIFFQVKSSHEYLSEYGFGFKPQFQHSPCCAKT